MFLSSPSVITINKYIDTMTNKYIPLFAVAIPGQADTHPAGYEPGNEAGKDIKITTKYGKVKEEKICKCLYYDKTLNAWIYALQPRDK